MSITVEQLAELLAASDTGPDKTFLDQAEAILNMMIEPPPQVFLVFSGHGEDRGLFAVAASYPAAERTILDAVLYRGEHLDEPQIVRHDLAVRVTPALSCPSCEALRPDLASGSVCGSCGHVEPKAGED